MFGQGFSRKNLSRGPFCWSPPQHPGSGGGEIRWLERGAFPPGRDASRPLAARGQSREEEAAVGLARKGRESPAWVSLAPRGEPASCRLTPASSSFFHRLIPQTDRFQSLVCPGSLSHTALWSVSTRALPEQGLRWEERVHRPSTCELSPSRWRGEDALLTEDAVTRRSQARRDSQTRGKPPRRSGFQMRALCLEQYLVCV